MNGKRTNLPDFSQKLDACSCRTNMQFSDFLDGSKPLKYKDFYGGRDRDRTCDPYHVKVVLYR
jgi:hypothetical protein